MFIKCLLFLFVLSFIEADFYYPASTCPMRRIKNGRARPRQRGTFIKFSCSPRYTLVGNKYATCRFGQWDVPAPVCVKSGCSQLQEVKNSVNMTYHNNAWVVFFCLPGHQLIGSPVVYCDGSNWNSTVPGCRDSSAKVSTECDFELPDLCGWKPDELHDFDWRRLNKKTPSSFLQTGPSYDHTYGKNGSGYYMYIETTGRTENETARLLSPVYDAELAKNGCFIFYYHMYGRGMGGLRVYQKPDRVPMYQLLSSSKRNNYLLFEQWGDQGNEWYSSASMLTDVDDDFQIVIEGIRGNSFMSDIAIDDVSIQRGENCTKAMLEATTPPAVLQESCVGRCDLYAEATGYRGCSCSIVCVVTQNCCPDFLDVCDLDGISLDSDARGSSTAALPQTQKLIATTPDGNETELSDATTATTKVTIPTTTSTKRPITTRSTTTSTTTKRPPIIIKRPTTTTKTTTVTKPTTTSPRTTTASPRTTTSTPKPTPKPTPKTTPKPTPKTTPKPTTTSRKPTTVTASTVTVSSKPLTMPIEVSAATEGTSMTPKQGTHEYLAKKSGGLSGATLAVTVIIAIAATFGLVWLAIVLTRSRGMAALARIRGRATSDPEVHYLKSDVDDE
uniref:Scavenger receptor SR-C-like protein n=1 Tax=Spodoptera frugiperda TaxID=7108 RepID=A0S6A2_SPOFR|nr:scavenger receptor SR-C-like protein [Spodoptera frugiperda]